MNLFKRVVPYVMGLVVVAGILGIFHSEQSPAVTASVNYTIQIVDHLGNVLGGIASASTASANFTVQVVNSSGNVLDFLGASTTIYPNTAPSAGQVLIGNAGGTAYAPQSLSQDCTNTSAGVVTCLKTNNVAFTGAATMALPVALANGGWGSTSPAFLAGISAPAGVSAATSITVKVPATTVNGDFLITALGVDSANIAAVPAAISGWVLVGAGALSANHSMLAFYSRTASSEPASYNFTWTGSSFGHARMFDFHSLATGAVDSTVTAYGTNNATSGNLGVAAAPTAGEVVIGAAEGSDGTNNTMGYVADVIPVFQDDMGGGHPFIQVGLVGAGWTDGTLPNIRLLNATSQFYAKGIIAVH